MKCGHVVVDLWWNLNANVVLEYRHCGVVRRHCTLNTHGHPITWNSISLTGYATWHKTFITIRTVKIRLQYAPQTLTGNLWENVSLAVQCASDLCHSILYFFFKPRCTYNNRSALNCTYCNWIFTVIDLNITVWQSIMATLISTLVIGLYITGWGCI